MAMLGSALPSSERVMPSVQEYLPSSVCPEETPSFSAYSAPTPARRDCATTSAWARSSRSPARRMPVVKSSKPVAMTSESSRNATTTSIRVKPRWRLVIDRHPSRQPVDVDEILALARGDRDASARRAAVGIEADRALLLAHGLGLRG